MKLTDDKKTFRAVVCVCVAFVLLFSGIIAAIVLISKDDGEAGAERTALSFDEIKGTWIASVWNLDFPSSPDLGADALKAEIDGIVKTVKDTGLNTVFFQVRPSSDALYESDIFPVSSCLSSDGTLTLDTLAYMTEAAHREGIAVHAWINPLRIAVGGDASDLDAKCPAAKNPSWCVKYADGKLYYDCGIPEVRETVAEGVREIVENYDVDGIVFDDYFYPYPAYDENETEVAFDDKETFARYGGDFENTEDWRRDNVNTLIKLVYDTVKEADENCLFGVSPFGIWKNGYGDESGSLTAGTQSYYDIFCDTVSWIKGGWVDYIAPQLYWRNDESAAPYCDLCDWWKMITADSGVKLVICHGAYRYEEWSAPEGTLAEQVAFARDAGNYGGSVFYGYEEIKNNVCGVREEIKSLYENPLTEN